MKEYKRYCPTCHKQLTYGSNSALWLATKHNASCKSCSSLSRASNQRVADLTILLNESPETYYWLGFLVADGTVSTTRLRLTVAIKDKPHLLKFAKYINYTGSFNEKPHSISIAVMDTTVVKMLRSKFDINSNKTCNPSRYEIPNTDLGLAFIAGFIDGDGSIMHQWKRLDYRLAIKLHGSWEQFLLQINKLLSNSITTRINTYGYAQFCLTNTSELLELKRKITDLNLPILNRKWDIINEHTN